MIEQQEEKRETVFTVNEAQLKGVSQCKNHQLSKIGQNEYECSRCPTVLTIDPNKNKVVNSKLVKNE